MASTVIGFKGKDFVILAADGNLERQYIKSIIDFNRIYHVEGNRLIGVVGETPEVQNLASFVQRNLALQHYVNGNKQTTESVVHWMHRQIADNLRKRDGMFFQTKTLFCGVDDEPKVFMLDEYGSVAESDYLACGIGSNFSLAILDRYWKRNMEKEDAIKLMMECVDEVRTRLLYSSSHYNIEICYKDHYEVVQGPVSLNTK